MYGCKSQKNMWNAATKPIYPAVRTGSGLHWCLGDHDCLALLGLLRCWRHDRLHCCRWVLTRWISRLGLLWWISRLWLLSRILLRWIAWLCWISCLHTFWWVHKAWICWWIRLGASSWITWVEWRICQFCVRRWSICHLALQKQHFKI